MYGDLGELSGFAFRAHQGQRTSFSFYLLPPLAIWSSSDFSFSSMRINVDHVGLTPCLLLSPSFIHTCYADEQMRRMKHIFGVTAMFKTLYQCRHRARCTQLRLLGLNYPQHEDVTSFHRLYKKCGHAVLKAFKSMEVLIKISFPLFLHDYHH